MKYEIIGNTMPAVEVTFDRAGEAMYTQSGGMAWMSAGVSMETNTRGGVLRGLGRMFAGESMFMATYTLRTQSAWQLVMKRVMDICGAVVGLILCGIISIFLIPAIKLDSPGPAIFSQIRIGKNGRRFKFYKFRSMYVDAEERKQALLEQNKMSGHMFKIDNDPRITKVGKFIRRTMEARYCKVTVLKK